MWKKLRDGYRQALGKKKCRTEQAATSINPWKYEKMMEFILPYMSNRPRSTNAVIQDHSSNNSQDESDNSLQQEFENNATEVTQNIKTVSPKSNHHQCTQKGNEKNLILLFSSYTMKANAERIDQRPETL